MFDFFKRRRSSASLVPGGGKDFREELRLFTDKLINHENFSLARFGDGEMIVINGESIDLSTKYNGEHKYIPGEKRNEMQRSLLRDALTYQSTDYYVGIACPCCVGEEKFFALKKQSGQLERQLTWANVFVNSNYQHFKESTTQALSTREIVLVCHKNAQPTGLPFEIKSKFDVGANAWLDDHARLLPELTSFIKEQAITDHVFLFCAGVLSNILIYELQREFPQNSYIDIGSVFDVELGLGKTRKYLKKGKTLQKTCVWR